MSCSDFVTWVDAALASAAPALDPRIRERFRAPLAAPHAERYTAFAGCMHIVACSPLDCCGVSLLPAHHARSVHAQFDIVSNRGRLLKRRRYDFARGSAFVFRSEVGAAPSPHERFDGPFGMRLRLDVIDGALRFRDDGYFIACGRWRLPLPRWVLGRFELIHTSMDARRFYVVLRVAHPLLETLFLQRGQFRGAEDPAHIPA
jgi:hypothetical protein